MRKQPEYEIIKSKLPVEVKDRWINGTWGGSDDVKAVSYIRVSGLSQADLDGPERQRLAIAEYAKQHGMTIEHEFFDAGIRGTKDFDDRPGLVELLEQKPNGIRVIIVEKLDRIARDLMIQESVLAKLKQNGFIVISVAEPDLMSDEPSRVLIRQILGAFYEFERKMIVSKLKVAKDRKRASGGKADGAYGYGCHPKRPTEVPILEKMRGMREGGMSIRAVTERLNSVGLRPRRGTVWQENTIARILRRA